MIFLNLPLGHNFGWGICGKYIAKELSTITDVKLATLSNLASVKDELDIHLLKQILLTPSEIEHYQKNPCKGPLLTAIDPSFAPIPPLINGTKRIGYTFFENNLLSPPLINNARQYYDLIITGSKWCTQTLHGYGINNVETIIQGIDPSIFNTYNNEKEYFKDKFVIFSGGKFELRKGQDIVIKAYKVLQDKYDDVMLINSWFNPWGESMKTMQESSLLNFDITTNDYLNLISNTLLANAIDTTRVITLPPLSNFMMPKIYQNTDIAIFPNRCEGGTNLVMMEYMARGKPVIASYNSGHKDILSENNAIHIKSFKPLTRTVNGVRQAIWEEPDLDETINQLEWAYHNREEIKTLGHQAGKDMQKITWHNTAKAFYNVLTI